MPISSTFESLSTRGLLQIDTREPLNFSCLWIEGVYWLEELGPEIVLDENSSMQPFATSAYGDWWCWVIGDNSNCGSVVLSPPDTGDCTFFTQSFDAFVFRSILEFLSNDVFCLKKDPENLRFTLDEIQKQLEIWQSQVGEYFPQKWIDILKYAAKLNSLTRHTESSYFSYDCLLTPQQVREIIVSELDFPMLDQTFDFDRLEIDWYP